jgi:hypothetical protein
VESPLRERLPESGSPSARSQLYRWTDEQGTIHVTNRAEAVPGKPGKEAR